MDVLGIVWQALGNAVNGVLQVIADFINLIISIVPNPDPFPGIVEGLEVSDADWLGYVGYWLDAAIDITFASGVLSSWIALMIASSVFAVIFWVIKAIKP